MAWLLHGRFLRAAREGWVHEGLARHRDANRLAQLPQGRLLEKSVRHALALQPARFVLP